MMRIRGTWVIEFILLARYSGIFQPHISPLSALANIAEHCSLLAIGEPSLGPTGQEVITSAIALRVTPTSLVQNVI
jgi:hypothetical protein